MEKESLIEAPGALARVGILPGAVEVWARNDNACSPYNFDERTTRANYHKNLMARLSAAFDIDSSRREKQLSLGMRIASFPGAIGLAASLFFLFFLFFQSRGRFSINAEAALANGTRLAPWMLSVPPINDKSNEEL